MAARACVVTAMLALAAACGDERAGGAPGARMAPDVEVVTLAPRPIERATEHVGAVKSRRSIHVQPQVEGLVTAIAVRSGQRVKAGELLVQIDDARQRALVDSLESVRAARAADLDYARQQAERQRILVEAGAVSEQEHEQAETSMRTAEAQLRAIEEQVRQERVQRAYHRVTATTAGVVGDVPVRVGDRVTSSTVLTTIDASEAFELYVYVPTSQAAGLRPGLSVRLLDERGGTLGTTAIDFVSPQVDARTQSVLAKAPLADDLGLRNGQLVRARIVWSEEPGLAVPVTAVTRINGRHFAFVAEEAAEGSVARQRPLRLGPIVGDDYLLLEGLAAGERLIVSGVQKIGDGAPIRARGHGEPAAAPAAGAAPQR
jgi:RND family efflux transporter MFP subunit